MRNIKLILEYDGTNYVGWQRQENGKSVQGEIEAVIYQVLQERVNIIGAGRTDAGVHARGQVANFQTQSTMMPEKLQAALNGLLPEDIRVLFTEEVPLDFHARYSAKERIYIYQITSKPSALFRHFAWHCAYALDVDLMNQTAKMILGSHDFQSFCKVKADVNHHQCNVGQSYWCNDNLFLRYTIAADRFLHGMVRALVGTMIDVGRGYITIDEFQRILECKSRNEAGMTAPAKGLILEQVIY